MSQKRNSGSEIITRGVLKKELKEELEIFGKALREEMRIEIRENGIILRQEIRAEFHQSLIDFYHRLIEPRFLKLEGDVSNFRTESLGRFDDLYKRFDDLKQEYVFANHQLKGIDFRLERLEQQNKPSRN